MPDQRTPQKVLVTGGGGFLGGGIVKLLRERGDVVYSFSRGYYPRLKALGIEQIRGDIRDKQAVEKALNGMDIVFHVAARPGVWGDYDDYFGVNVTGTRNVIAACMACGIKRLVYTSSPSVIFDGRDMAGVNESTPYPEHYHAHYPKTKAMAEQEVKSATDESLKTIILRPHLIWGPGDNHLVPRILKRANRLRRIGDGLNLVDTVYIDNAAHAHVLAADQLNKHPELSGNVYFISQDEPVRLWDMIDNILKAGGKGPVKGSFSRQTAWIIGTICEGIFKLLRLQQEPPMTRFVANELATSHWFDINAARRDLGYEPLVSIEEGLSRLSKWLKR